MSLRTSSIQYADGVGRTVRTSGFANPCSICNGDPGDGWGAQAPHPSIQTQRGACWAIQLPSRAAVLGFPPSALKPFHLPLSRTRFWGKLELEQSSFPTAGPAGSMKKQLRVKSINSFITELLQSQRYFNCARWEVLMRDTSHFHWGPQGEGTVRQFQSRWLQSNADVPGKTYPLVTWNFTPE